MAKSLKVFVPEVPELIFRPRLNHLLEQSLKKKLTVLVAPTGYGKTVATAEFARQAKKPVIWHELSLQQRDALTLHNMVATRFSNLIPETKDCTVDTWHAPGELATRLANTIANLNQEIIYVVDDYELIMRFPDAEHWFQTFISLTPPQLHIIILSQEMPPLPTASLFTQNQLQIISEKELQFNESEIAQVASHLDEKTRALINKIEGWPTGVMMLVNGIQAELPDTEMHNVFEKLARSLFDSQPLDIQQFLISSSCLTTVTPEKCVRMLGINDAYRLMTQVCERNLFITAVTGGWRYHPLFKTFLQNELKSRDAAKYTMYHQTIGNTLSQDILTYDEAWEHFILARRYDEAAEIAERTANLYYRQGRFFILQRFHDGLSGQVQTPRLDLHYAMLAMKRNQMALAEEVLNQISTKDVDDDFKARFLIQRANLHRFKGEHQQSLSLMEKLNTNDYSKPIQADITTTKAVAHMMLGGYQEAIEGLNQTLKIQSSLQDEVARAQTLQYLSYVYEKSGDNANTKDALQELIAIRRTQNNQWELVDALVNLGYHHLAVGEYKTARETLTEALNNALRAGYITGQSFAMWNLGDVHRNLGEFETAQQYYEGAYQENTLPELRTGILLSQAMLQWWQNDDHIVSTIFKAINLATKHQIAMDLDVARAFDMLMTEPDIDALDQIMQKLHGKSAFFELCQILPLYGYACLQTGQTTRFDNWLRQANKWAEQGQGISLISAAIAHVPLLKDHFDERTQRYPALTKHYHKITQHQPENQQTRLFVSQSSATYRLEIETLGTEVVKRNGRVVPISMWVAARSRELFFYLLLKGEQRRQEIVRNVWPVSDKGVSRSNFSMTVKRARQAVGENVIVWDDDRYRLDAGISIECDALRYEQLLSQVKLLQASDPLALNIWIQITQLFKGTLLPYFESKWLDVLRQHYLLHYIKATDIVAENALARGQYEQAIELYEQALLHDPYRELTYRNLINAHLYVGEGAKAKRQYKTLCELFWTDLQQSPSGETQQIARENNLM